MTDDTKASEPASGRTAKQYVLGVQTLYVLLGNLFPLLISWPLQVYVSQVLGAEGIGTYALIEGSIGAAGVLLGLGIGNTAVRFLPAHLRLGEFGLAKGLIRQGLLLLSIIGGVGFFAVLVSLNWVEYLWSALALYRWEIGVMALFIPLSLCSFFLQQCLRGMNAIGPMIFGTMILQIVLRAVAVLALLSIGWQLRGYIVANLFAAACGALWLSAVVLRRMRSFDETRAATKILAEWRRYAMICYSESLVGALASALEQLILGFWMGPASVGVLSVARQLRQLPERFNQMLLMTGAPMLSAAHGYSNSAERQYLYNAMTRWSVIASLPLILFLLFFGRELLALYGSEFAAQGWFPLMTLTAGQLFSLLCGPVGNVAMMSGLEKQSVHVTVWQSILSTIVLVPFVIWWGVNGAAITLAGNVIFNNVALVILVRCKLDLKWWDMSYIAWLPIVGAAVCVAGLAMEFLPPVHPAELVLVAIFMYAAAIGAMVVFGMSEDDRVIARVIGARIMAILRIQSLRGE